MNSKGNPIFGQGNLYRLVKYVNLVQKWNQDSSKIHCYPVLLGERSRSPAMMYFPAKRGAKRLPESSNQRVDGIIKWDPSLGGSNETTKQALGVFKGIFKISQRNQSAWSLGWSHINPKLPNTLWGGIWTPRTYHPNTSSGGMTRRVGSWSHGLCQGRKLPWNRFYRPRPGPPGRKWPATSN